MRKTIMALILVIPMVFVLVVFSSVKIAALSVDISASSIRIYADNVEDGTLYVDMSEEQEYTVTAKVMPENAKNRGYRLTSDKPNVVEVTDEGKLILKREGTAVITATSDDKGYTDSLSVVVAASGPYALSFSLYDEGNNDILSLEEDGSYSAELNTGWYGYSVSIQPAEYKEYTLTASAETTAIIDEGESSILFPFSGEASFTVAVPGSSLKKDVHINVKKPHDGILVNGGAGDNAVKLAWEARRTSLYIESDSEPQFICEEATAQIVKDFGNNRYLFDIEIAEGFASDRLTAQIIAGDQTAEITFIFMEFDYRISSDLAIETENGVRTTAVALGNSYRFYAVSSVTDAEITYEWTLENGQDFLTVSEDGTSCTVNVGVAGEYRLHVCAKRNGASIGDEYVIVINAVESIGAVRITNKINVDLAEAYTIAGNAYDSDLNVVKENYLLKTYTFTPGKPQPLVKGGDELQYSVSDPTIARVEIVNGDVYVVPLAEGQVTITVAWRWNKAFKTTLSASLVLNVISDAVSVTNASEYMRAMDEKRVTVLKNDISLGTDRSGAVYDDATLSSMLKRMKSTYNIEWYKHTDLVSGGMDLNEDDAYVSYVSEITNDLYGNGFSIDADAFTHALDGTGKPRLALYRGPLYFVAYSQMASVAGQDNCAFLIRTDGIKLYGVNLLGCKDESLLSDTGAYDLTQLNLVGTTLEVNADCDIINCRIRNGRNVIRAYGGNRNGNNYFVDSLSGDSIAEEDRIHVNIDGCILSQGREFILKIGANRALRANIINGAEPQLRNQSGSPYAVNGKQNWYNDLWNDEYFYDHYVMTDVTLQNSVLETSGFFTVGIESNFAGTFLYNGTSQHKWREFTKSWEYSGGTSFASVLRLKGDVRLYDWKDISLVDSSTLIESPGGALSSWLKLDVAKMLDFVHDTDPDKYGNVFETQDGKKFVHGGIAYYGGGRNYSCLDLSGFTGKYGDFEHYNINISVLSGAKEGDPMKKQGELLPSAAGTNDFNFFMYSANSPSNYSAQVADTLSGEKYKGVKAVSAFPKAE